MPETAVDKDCLFPAWEHNVRFARQSGGMNSVAVAKGEQRFPQNQLGLGVFGFDLCHVAAALLDSMYISHPENVTSLVQVSKGHNPVS